VLKAEQVLLAFFSGRQVGQGHEAIFNYGLCLVLLDHFPGVGVDLEIFSHNVKHSLTLVELGGIKAVFSFILQVLLNILFKNLINSDSNVQLRELCDKGWVLTEVDQALQDLKPALGVGQWHAPEQSLAAVGHQEDLTGIFSGSVGQDDVQGGMPCFLLV